MTNEELLRAYYDGDRSAFEKLYQRNLNFIKKVAVEAADQFHCVQYQGTGRKKYTDHTAVILDDLCAEGAAEFWDRIQRREYDESKALLTTYLYPHLKGRMYRWLEQNIGSMSLSKIEMEAVRQAQRLYHAEWKNTAEVAAEMGISVEEAAKHIGYHTHFYARDDSREYIGDTEPFDFQTGDSSTFPADEIVHNKLCAEYLWILFQRLSAKDRYILGHYYGAFGYEEFSVAEIGLREMLTDGGVKKAIEIAEGHLQGIYSGSKLQRWLRANHLFKKAWNAATDA